ncbi:MAG: DHH family phosphoesterase [Xenococcaceae cyanobacterium]
MPQLQPQWQVLPPPQVPQWFIEAAGRYTLSSDGRYAAQLLWQRGIQDPIQLPGFLDPDYYQPTSPFAFGQEMKWAVKRLQKAREAGEKVVIWGDFDADGITSTSVLWEGLGQFFSQHQQLSYYIPNRLTESHGLNCQGIDKLAVKGTKLIVTCDTGSTNLSEIDYAHQLGIDIIITDHHTLPDERPSVISIINPRYFAETHPLFHLSGVAVAYKLVEALYQTLPDIPQQPVEDLLDLVAIGLIADLVQLSGDCRYLAQRGIEQLQKQASPVSPTRPGVAHLLKLCQRSGDRPTDISFGLGPRINAVSRIQGDASFCVELLTSRDPKRCKQLALDTELANTRRKSLQMKVHEQVKKKLARIDLSTTSVIVLEDPQWQSGVLGLVAGQIAQEYGRPTILLSTSLQRETMEQGDWEEGGGENFPLTNPLARGSARSVNNIDLYQLVQSQAHLLHRFGGHPYAAGLSLPVENIPLFREAINQQALRKNADVALMTPIIETDLIVTVAELGKVLFRELKLLEPCGMGNPVPKLLIQNCWFEEVWHKNFQDLRGKKVQYIKTTFEIWDDSVSEGFPGIWWGHYKEELPQNQLCDAIVELDFNAYKKCYEARLIAVRASTANSQFSISIFQRESLIDWRGMINEEEIASSFSLPSGNDYDEQTPLGDMLRSKDFRLLKKCPISWDEIQIEYRRAIAREQKLALAYSPPNQLPPQQIWEQLVGIGKYLSRTGKTATKAQFHEKLGLSDRTLNLGLKALSKLGFECQNNNESLQFSGSCDICPEVEHGISSFLEAVEEEQFQRQYFYQVSLSTLQGILAQTAFFKVTEDYYSSRSID